MNPSKERPVGWGVIGCGQIAFDKVMPGIRGAANAGIVGLSDPDDGRRDRAVESSPGATGYADFHEMLRNPEVEAVYIATPNAMHPEQTIAAAEAGKHVLVEKPMALTAADGYRMIEAAERAGVSLMVAYMTLFNPAYEHARRWVSSGALGEIVSVRGRHSYVIDPEGYSPAAAWRLDDSQGGGPLMDVAVYPIATIRDLLGQPCREVSATGTTRRLHGLTSFDSVLFSFLLADGTPGVIEAGFTYPSSLFEVEGTKGRLSLSGHVSQGTTGDLRVELYGAGRGVSERISHTIDRDSTPQFQNYLREVEHFSACIRDGQTPVATGRVAVQDLEVTTAVRQSILTATRVQVGQPVLEGVVV